MDGHYFFYPLYHDLVAETESERTEVRDVVRDLTDHIIAHGFGLRTRYIARINLPDQMRPALQVKSKNNCLCRKP